MPIDPNLPAERKADPARIRAANLFDAAARSSLTSDPGARLQCLAAGEALIGALPAEAREASFRQSATEPAHSADPASLVRAALNALGSLPIEQFAAARDIRDATEHGRRALRRLP
jgi:hypothetical protein